MNVVHRRRLGGSGLGLDPGTLPGLELRLRGLTVAGNPEDQISPWGDTSGNGRDASQATAARRPYISGGSAANPNSPTGKRAIGFDRGSPSYMTGAFPATPISLTSGYTFYLWGYAWETINDQTPLDILLTVKLVVSDGGGKIAFIDSLGAQSSTTVFSIGYHSLVWVFEPPNTTGAAKIYFDGSRILTTTWNFTQGAATGYTLGANSVLTTPYAGNIHELDFFSVAHDAGTIARVLLYGKNFYGI